MSSCPAEADSRLAHLSSASLRMLVLTLLFLGVVGLRRTWDLRGYTGDALALLDFPETGLWLLPHGAVALPDGPGKSG